MTTKANLPFVAAAALFLAGLLLVIAGLVSPVRHTIAQPPATAPSESPAAAAEQTETTGTLTVHFFDVGQGDATLLAGPESDSLYVVLTTLPTEAADPHPRTVTSELIAKAIE